MVMMTMMVMVTMMVTVMVTMMRKALVRQGDSYLKGTITLGASHAIHAGAKDDHDEDQLED